MLARTLFFALVALGSIIGGLSLHFYRVFSELSPVEPKPFQLLTSTDNRKPLYQYRAHIAKDLWLTRENERLHHQINSDFSVLKLIFRGRNFTLIEELSGITGLVQEEINQSKAKTTQRLRSLKAEKGVYDYSQHCFSSQLMHIGLFSLPGKELPKKIPDQSDAYARVIAQEASFFLTAPTPKLQAKVLRATIDEK